MNVNFIGIGIPKSGTSWLHHNLNQLMEFNLPPVKEMNYFDRNSKYPSSNKLSKPLLIDRLKSKSYIKDAIRAILICIKNRDWDQLRFYWKWYFSNYSDEWYLSLFQPYKGYTGEFSPSYALIDKEDIRQMYKVVPHAKLILMLRNPVERAWSNYVNNIRRNKELLERFNEASAMNFLNSDMLATYSDYSSIIDKFSAVFPKEQILICFYDAIKEKPFQLFETVVNFITDNKPVATTIADIKKVVNKSPSLECPKHIEQFLKDKYYHQIKKLSDDYGGYFSKWLSDLYEEDNQIKESEFVPTLILK